jgi:hypothetical protein
MATGIRLQDGAEVNERRYRQRFEGAGAGARLTARPALPAGRPTNCAGRHNSSPFQGISG